MVGGKFTTILSNIQILYLIVRKVVMGVFFFFTKKIDVPCKLKNEMTLTLEFFLQKKKQQQQPKLARWARAARISCTVF